MDVIQDAGEEFCLDGQYVWSVSLVHPTSDEFLERQFLGIVKVCKCEIFSGWWRRRSVPRSVYKVRLV
jgi:hypothetical protein